MGSRLVQFSNYFKEKSNHLQQASCKLLCGISDIAHNNDKQLKIEKEQSVKLTVHALDALSRLLRRRIARFLTVGTALLFIVLVSTRGVAWVLFICTNNTLYDK